MLKRFEHGGNIYAAPPPGKAWLDFSANINPLGLSPAVKEAMTAHIDAVVHYPDPKGTALRAALERTYGVSSDSLLLGNGAAELFYLYMHTFRPRRVLLPVPSFSEYERAARAIGAAIDYCHLSAEGDFSYPWETLRAACGHVDCIIIGNPNNPTGTLASAHELKALTDLAARKGTDILVDESFLDFLPSEEAYSVRELAQETDSLFVIRSLTKFYALPGLRLGFGVTTPLRRSLMEGHKDDWNVNVLAQYAGVAALGDRDYQNESRRLVAAERDRLYAALTHMSGIEVCRPCVNFLLWRLADDIPAEVLIEALRDEGILVRSCANYVGLSPSYIRTAVRSPWDNKSFIQILQEKLTNLRNLQKNIKR
ncbi:threonine-phosphate decarboxylase CobD [Megasphaera sp.]|uniref:threonine-phosphate decarboxylase CobD n=1 Tax=Megasphaera sp. TaxID=2023260 RepID=UPI0025884DA8|nr:threonine-phosphate decarboxylase CobD [Megasphaera sp.]